MLARGVLLAASMTRAGTGTGWGAGSGVLRALSYSSGRDPWGEHADEMNGNGSSVRPACGAVALVANRAPPVTPCAQRGRVAICKEIVCLCRAGAVALSTSASPSPAAPQRACASVPLVPPPPNPNPPPPAEMESLFGGRHSGRRDDDQPPWEARGAMPEPGRGARAAPVPYPVDVAQRMFMAQAEMLRRSGGAGGGSGSGSVSDTDDGSGTGGRALESALDGREGVRLEEVGAWAEEPPLLTADEFHAAADPAIPRLSRVSPRRAAGATSRAPVGTTSGNGSSAVRLQQLEAAAEAAVAKQLQQQGSVHVHVHHHHHHHHHHHSPQTSSSGSSGDAARTGRGFWGAATEQ
jgi:hypothetical protein